MLKPRFSNSPELFERNGNPWVSRDDRLRMQAERHDPPTKKSWRRSPKVASMKQISRSADDFDLELLCREARFAKLARDERARFARTALEREFAAEDAPDRVVTVEPYVDKLSPEYLIHKADTGQAAFDDFIAKERAEMAARRARAMKR